ncbi:MAG: 2-C-methyl-D-erythritol 4-phosphate cytidylyltransferase [Herbinix sp.]|jgi:2-C-methyl-D-erythritol 4-phosphate cytidylyltransferase|nr:2-C-methyl-D-erythritol 4-phosphate cytidylyltransferase [Herbinix sp.]
MNKVIAIVLAAGQGKRMNNSVAKQFLVLRDKPVIYYSLKAFELSGVDEIILVTGEGQVDYCRREIVELYHINKVTKIIEGGKERYDSVYQGLMSAEKADYVMIHDGARPFITTELINRMIDSVKEWKACIIGMPVKETIKEVDDQGNIIKTPNRNTLWAAQTPQAFDYPTIKQAYENYYHEKDAKGIVVTDDAMLYEAYGTVPVKVLPGDYNNIKLTTPDDLLLAERIMMQMGYSSL